MKEVHINYSSGRVKAEIASSQLQKAKGLRGRTSGKMLFQFNKLKKPSMEMIGVKKPLYMYGMLELSNNAALVVTKKRMKPFKLRDRSTWTTYSPDKPVHYILESFEQLDLKKNDKVTFTDPELETIF